MATLEELTTPLTRAEMETKIYAAIAARGASTTTWKPGAVVRTIVFAVAVILAALSKLSALLAKSGFLELSAGDWLALVAHYVYGTDRIGATFANGTITVNNTGGGVYSGGAGDLVARRSSDGKTYRATAAWSIGALQVGVVIPVEATEAGSASSAAANDVDELETTLIGVVVVASSTMVGTDAELDPALQARARAKTGILSPNGPADAYAYVCKSAVDAAGVNRGITRVRTVADGEGGVIVYVADTDGAVSGTTVAALQEEIEAKAEPNAVTAEVVSATSVVIDYSYELWVLDTSGLDNGEIETAAEALVTAFLGTQPIGGVKLLSGDAQGKVWRSALEATIAAAANTLDESGTTITDRKVRVVLTVPAADVALDVDEVPVPGVGTAIAIHQVPAGTV